MTLHSRIGRAFTLIETVIVIGLTAIMMTVLSLLIYTFNTSSSYEQTSMQSSVSASAIMREIESLTLPADAVLGAHAFPGGTYTSTTTSLVLEIPSIDSSGNIIAGAHDYAAFYSVGTNAYRLLQSNASSKRGSGTKQLSSTVSALTFTYSDADFAKVSTTTVDVQTQASVKGHIFSDHRREELRLRNH